LKKDAGKIQELLIATESVIESAKGKIYWQKFKKWFWRSRWLNWMITTKL